MLVNFVSPDRLLEVLGTINTRVVIPTLSITVDPSGKSFQAILTTDYREYIATGTSSVETFKERARLTTLQIFNVCW